LFKLSETVVHDWVGLVGIIDRRGVIFLFFLIFFLSSFILDIAWRSSFCGVFLFSSFHHSEVLSVVRLSYYFTLIYFLFIPFFPFHAHRALLIIFIPSWHIIL